MKKTIALPQWLMRQLNLHDGDQIKPIIDGGSIRLTPFDQFLSLRGILKMILILTRRLNHLIKGGNHGNYPNLFGYFGHH